jgi:hypothetical protein
VISPRALVCIALSTLGFAALHCGGEASGASTSGDAGGGDAGGIVDAPSADDDAVAAKDAAKSALSLATCTTKIPSDVPDFYKKYFRCVTITATADGVTIHTEGLPPHLSSYYGIGNANYAPFDTSRGAQYHANPNILRATAVTITIPNAPVAKGVIVTSALVDGQAQTSPLEYGLGPAGVGLDSVLLFDATAAPGDDIANERFTFDDYEGHPAPQGAYHYHGGSKGPLEALAANGVSQVELFGVMCDGTVVLGCTELDGSARPTADLDAQGGHVHDLEDQDGKVHFTARYHTHVCTKDGGHAYTPEIQYYTTCMH